MDTIAFGLREEYAGTVTQNIDGQDVEVPYFTGGVIRAGERDVNVRELLDEGDGTIVVAAADTELTAALLTYEPLKRVEAPQNARGIDELETLTVAALRDIAKGELGLEGAGRASKPTLIAAIREARERRAGGERIAPDTSVTDLAAPTPDPATPDPAGEAGQEN